MQTGKSCEKNCEKAESEYVDLMEGKCYGHQVLTKLPNQQRYKGLCPYPCRLKAECISASREDKEMRELSLMQIPYDEGILNRNYQQNEDGELDYADDPGGKILADETQQDQTAGRDSFDVLLIRLGVNPELRETAKEFLRRFSCLYFHQPKLLHSAMLRNWHGLTQADQARLRKVTRQAVNDGIMKELAGVSRVDIHIPDAQLSTLEKVVYVLLSDGKTLRESAKILNVGSKDKIARIRQKISKKTGRNETVKTRKKKKI